MVWLRSRRYLDRDKSKIGTIAGLLCLAFLSACGEGQSQCPAIGEVAYHKQELKDNGMSSEVGIADIFEKDPMYETDNGFVIYRTDDREMDCDYAGDYLAVQDAESGDIIYLPDSFGKILDVKVEEGAVRVRCAEWEGSKEREMRIPVHFSRGEETDIYPYCDEKVLAQKGLGLEMELEELPRQVWRAGVQCGEESYELVFTCTSPIYQKLFVEAGELRADYCLAVEDASGNVRWSQMLVDYPVAFEEACWLEDFSGDGVADLAFCTEMVVGTDYFGSSLKTFIWNGERGGYEHKELPESGWGFCPSWHREEAVIVQPSGPRRAPEYWEMYAFLDEQWRCVRRLEPEYEADEVGFYWPVGYREIIYQDGEVQEESDLQEEIDLQEEMGSIWLDDDSTVELHTFGDEWTSVPMTIGGRTIKKEVMVDGCSPMGGL